MADERNKDGSMLDQTDQGGVRSAEEEEARLAKLADEAIDPLDRELDEIFSGEPIPISQRTFKSRKQRSQYERSWPRMRELSAMNGLSVETNSYLENKLFGYAITNDLLETIKKPDFEAVVRKVLEEGDAQLPLNEQLCFQCVQAIRLIRRIAELDGYRKEALGTHFAAASGESDFEGYQTAKARFAKYPEPTLGAAIEDGEKQAAHWEDEIRELQQQLNALLETMTASVNAIKNHSQEDSITVKREHYGRTDGVISLYTLTEGMGVFTSKAEYGKIQGLIYPEES